MACFQWNEVGRTNTGARLFSIFNTARNLTVAIREARWLISKSEYIAPSWLAIILIMWNSRTETEKRRIRVCHCNVN